MAKPTDDDFNSWTPDKRDLFCLRVLLQALADEPALPSQKAIANEAGVAVDTVTRFKRDNENGPQEKTVQKNARRICSGILKVCRSEGLSRNDFAPFESVFDHLFGFAKLNGGSDANNQPVRIIHDSVIHETVPPATLDTGRREKLMRVLQGFWFILRPLSETGEALKSPTDTPTKLSLSLLNIISDDVLEGAYPFFKIRQAPGQGKPGFKIEGVLVPTPSGATFVGRREYPDTFFSMTSRFEIDDDYQTHVRRMQGLILGIAATSERNVASRHHCVFVPGTDSLKADDAFTEAETKLKALIATAPVDDVRDRMKAGGVGMSDADWKQVIDSFRPAHAFTSY